MKIKSLSKLLFLLFLCNSVFAQKIHRESFAIKAIVNQWVNAHNNKDLVKLKDLYDEKLLFYCMELSKEECLKKKKKSLESLTSLTLDPIGDIIITEYNSGIIRCDFIKDVSKNGKTKSYPSYLLLRKQKDKYKIVGESDKITDKNLNFSLSIGEKTPFHDIQIEASPNVTKTNNSIIYMSVAGLIVLVIFAFLIFSKKSKDKVGGSISKDNLLEVVYNDLRPNERKGYLFEQCIASKFDPKYFKIITWRGDKGIIGNWAETNKDPDIEFEFKHNNYSKKFAIECKWRQDLYNDHVDLGKEDKLIQYKNFQKKNRIPVYLVIGLGGTPQKPKDIYLVPLDETFTTKIHKETLKGYKKLSQNFFFDGHNNVLS